VATPLIHELGGSVISLDTSGSAAHRGWSLFNPSIAQNNEGAYAIVFRSSNYIIKDNGMLSLRTGSKVANRVVFANIDENLKLSAARIVNFEDVGVSLKRGVEDPKLLWRGKWDFTGVMMEAHTPVARNCYCHMSDDSSAVVKIDIESGVDAKKPEKNWMTANNKPQLFDYIYGPNSVVVGEKIISFRRDNEKISGIRGSSHLLELGDGTYLAVVHRLHTRAAREYSATRMATVDVTYKNYHHFFARYDEYGKMIELSDPFQFLSTGVEFAAGLVKMNDNYVISFGKKDIASYVAVLPISRVMRSLNRI
jgi:hypothetical protein